MFRNIYLRNPAQITLDHYQLAITTLDSTYHFPFDDVQSLLIENLKSSISTAALAELASHGIAVITCDAQHLPIATLLPFQGYYQHLKTLNYQLKLTKRFKDRLTRKIIKQKISNQAATLSLVSGKPQTALQQLAAQVTDGDDSARESIAAKAYFAKLGGPKFSRRQENLTNGALNYGYAIVRSCLARELIQFGFEPALGFNHHNQQNAFNLADDLIEPFRPAVELYVFTKLATSSAEELTSSMKAHLLNLLSYEVIIQGERQSIQYAIHLVVESLWGVCQIQKSTQLVLPEIVALRVHENGE
ncbi:type II CRISPR-associated endonuclease Cas1 [Levilactobacillus brevis]|uniref:type II CRISPR-associated endonuclease Cas1 n=1 Tax=Levilactobacillus brevis TaxID=1580 RepID=UPI000B402801|nr:type II CRISPR-associated endonuclease Cas1 [Levilactobacillus brevis]